MKIKNIIEEDFIQYKKASMFIAMPNCSFKCCLEYGNNICQNSSLVKSQTIEVNSNDLIKRYLNNDITSSIVFGGLEPFDSFDDIFEFIRLLRDEFNCHDDIVIYTGYKEEEIEDKVKILTDKYDNIIIKFGRFIPSKDNIYDDVLGVKLASPNQYAIRY